MKGKRYTKEFKIEAIKQVTDRGYLVAEVAVRRGTTPHHTTPQHSTPQHSTQSVCPIKEV